MNQISVLLGFFSDYKEMDKLGLQAFSEKRNNAISQGINEYMEKTAGLAYYLTGGRNSWNFEDVDQAADIGGKFTFDIGTSLVGPGAFLAKRTMTAASEVRLIADAEQQLIKYIAGIGRNPPATAIGAVDPTTGRIVTMSSGPVPAVIAPELKAYADSLGGLGVKTACGNTIGRCAEFRAANELMLSNPRLKLEDIKFTAAVRPRSGLPVPRCDNCKNIFGGEQYMEMDEEFLEVNDIDWFAVGADGYVCHFATGGRGFVPRQVASSIEGWQLVCDYIYSLPICSGVIVVEESLPDFSGLAQREAYLGSFLEMASRGIFSHDVSGDGYRLIAKPELALRDDDLPERVRNHIPRIAIGSDDVLLHLMR